jgi:hypothetical protein
MYNNKSLIVVVVDGDIIKSIVSTALGKKNLANLKKI